jgi:hypothetical protein
VRLLVTIDLSGADLDLFEAYEAAVLPLLANYGGRLEMRVRALDGSRETHLVFFPDARSCDNYRADPHRAARQSEWERCGAIAARLDVERIGS